MLSYTKTAVTRNASEKKINSLLDFVSSSTDMKLLQVSMPLHGLESPHSMLGSSFLMSKFDKIYLNKRIFNGASGFLWHNIGGPHGGKE